MRRLVDLVGKRRHDNVVRPCVPEGVAIFAIGDLHGRADLLVEMHKRIIAQSKNLPANIKKIAVYMGDYVDRGPDSAEVIDLLVAAPLAGFRAIHLLGNHDLSLISYLRGERDFMSGTKVGQWLFHEGGLATLKSYGVQTSTNTFPENIRRMRIELLRKIPTDHIEFLQALTLNYSIGDYYFVHAGIDPTKPLNEQKPSDMLHIREKFLQSQALYEKVIVHGHTPYKSANIQNNRIGLDTEAEVSGILSGVMLMGDKMTLLEAKSDANMEVPNRA